MNAATDIRTPDGLRAALLRLPAEGGWSGPLGRDLLAAVLDACRRMAASVERTTRVADPHRVDDLTSRVWECLFCHTDRVIAAEDPWAYVMRTVQHQAVTDTIAQALLTGRSAVHHGRTRQLTWPHRAGDDTARILDRPATHNSSSPSSPQHWGQALTLIHARLVELGADEQVTRHAMLRIIDLAAKIRSRHCVTGRDELLTQRLGLSREQVGHLQYLLLGPVRGRPEQSLWWVLHAQPRGHDGRPLDPWTPPIRHRMLAYAAPFRQLAAAG